jgi:hypothetical protein
MLLCYKGQNHSVWGIIMTHNEFSVNTWHNKNMKYELINFCIAEYDIVENGVFKIFTYCNLIVMFHYDTISRFLGLCH